MNIVKTVFGALGGFTAGVIAGILFAPEGSENRGYIMEMEDVHVRPRIAKLDEPLKPDAELYLGIKHLTYTLANKGKTTLEEPKEQV